MRRAGLSFQTRFQLLVLLSVALPLLAMGTYTLGQHHAILEEKVRESLSNQLFRLTNRLDDWIQQREHEVTRWSTSFIVFEGMEALAGPREDAEQARTDLRDYLATVLSHHPVYESLFVLDARGRVMAGTRAETWEPWDDRDAVLSAADVQTGLVSPVYRSPTLGRPTAVVMHPIQGRAPMPLGWLVGRLKLAEMEALLAPRDGTAAFWLLDGQGGIVARAGGTVEAPGSRRFPAPLPEGVAGQVREGRLSGFGPTVYGLRRRQGPVAGFVAATVPADVAYASLSTTRRRLVLLGLGFLLPLLLLSVLLGRSLLRPVDELARAAQRVKAGDYDVHVPVRGRDELTDLARTFNEMAAQIGQEQRRLQSEKRQFEELSITDDLTGLFNRRHFDDELQAAVEACGGEGQPLSLLLIDLDRFKEYNDRWGHLEGDAELRRVAATVQAHVRSGRDKGFRYGGEELAVLLPGCGKERAAERAESVRQAVRAARQRPQAAGRHTTVSIGVATFPEDGSVPRTLIDRADQALYSAKDLGRDRVVLAAPPPAGMTAAG